MLEQEQIKNCSLKHIYEMNNRDNEIENIYERGNYSRDIFEITENKIMSNVIKQISYFYASV